MTILSTAEAGGRRGGGGGQKGGGLCYAMSPLAVAIPTREGQCQRLAEEEFQADYKSCLSSSFSSAQLFPLHLLSLFYLVFPVLWPVRQLAAVRGGQRGRVEG